ncbi:uncharacterized protein LOC106644290 [Copidosoma floridanum]|uniref:uncharacterized protein LOC106644290 n=1 Tax=Copidosoma floridanum TaxID=29053 RepID=UPI0006C9B761|nr:uncharacterized protein LOC106644290 [Copidosoma floridanum]
MKRSMSLFSWLRPRWPCFVANRCSNIFKLMSKAEWHHIRSSQNPADIASQGIHPDQMREQCLWFSGRDILHELQPKYPKLKIEILEDLLYNVNVLIKTKGLASFVTELYGQYSKWERLFRVTAYCLRFVYKLFIKVVQKRVNIDLTDSYQPKLLLFL